jgi:pimeloyl-ACP methyl ester carboxylesterase
VLLFQIPFVDVWIERSEAKLFLWMMKSSAPEGTFSEQDLEVYRTAFSRPGRARAVLAYYRQALQRKELFQERLRLHRRPRVTVPSTVVWGDADMALHPRQAERITRFVERVEVRRLPGVSHWVPEERPEAVAQAIIDADRASSPE